MGQVAVESSEFCKLVESTYYRDATHLRDTFPSAFKTAHAAITSSIRKSWPTSSTPAGMATAMKRAVMAGGIGVEA
jgi:hypothetical protein